MRRIVGESRRGARKPLDVEMAERNHTENKPLMGYDAEHLLTLDTTELEPKTAADAIAKWAMAQN